MKELERTELQNNQCIPFEWVHDEYGRAEFQICAKYKRRKLVEMFIYPQQQPNATRYYHWQGEGCRDFSIYSVQKLEEPRIWKLNWCKEHKCQMIRLYVPTGAKYFWFQEYSFINMVFTRENFSDDQNN